MKQFIWSLCFKEKLKRSLVMWSAQAHIQRHHHYEAQDGSPGCQLSIATDEEKKGQNIKRIQRHSELLCEQLVTNQSKTCLQFLCQSLKSSVAHLT